MARQRVDPLGAEVRAVTEGLRAWRNENGTFRVRSVSRPGLWWTVTVGMVKTPEGWRLKMGCTCESGQARPGELVACQHAACVARSLEHRGLARWVGGTWEPVRRLVGAA